MAEVIVSARPARRRRARHRSPRRQERAALLLAVLAALALVTLALPRTVASILRLPADRTLDQLRRLPVDPQALDRLIAAEAAASVWIDAGDLWEDVAAGHLARLRATSSADPQAALDILLQAESALQRSLARRPGNAVAWWQLAWVANLLERPPERVAAALRLSVVTGNRVETLLFPRLQLALAKWPGLDAAARQAFRPQLALALARDPQRFVILVRRSLAQDEVRAAFHDRPDLLAQYEARLD